MERLIGVPELARRLGKDQSTIHRRIHRGTLTPVGYAGKQPLFTEADAEALARGEVQLRRDADIPSRTPTVDGGRTLS